MKLTRRGLIRLISLGVAAIAVLLIRDLMLMRENRSKDLTIRNNYVRALEDLSAAADNINNTLEKQLYAGTAQQQAALADKLFNEAAAAKAAMLQLPMQELSLENTYKFLSQVGNYARSLAKKSERGEELSEQEYKDLKTLHEFSDKLAKQMWSLEESVSSGERDISSVSNNNKNEGDTPSVTEGFTEFEQGFESYPTLIYDGPFSDHLMQKDPLMLKNEPKVSKNKALERASMMLNISSNDLSQVTDADGDMPSWIFSDKDGTVACAVTKNGGYVSYFLKSRKPNSASLEVKEAAQLAVDFVDNAGYHNMKMTYYERVGNVVTVNFAYSIDGVTCYTDLIKASVAMDDGEILGFEAAGYLVNHKQRKFPDDVISMPECKKKLSPYLECLDSSKAVIPSDGGKELYCYEFKCRSEEGRNVLVYINAQTGIEEQIMILLENESGTLAM